MERADYLLIGGGLASARAVKTLRQRDPRGSIVLVTEEDRLPYDRPPLSKEVIRGELAPEEIVSEEDAFYPDNRVTTLVGLKVTALELGRSSHAAVLSNGETLPFGKALLATGGIPRRLGVPGEDLSNVHALRSADDAVAIRDAATNGGQAVIVGAGFIGVELAASLTQRGMKVTVVEMADEVWSAFAPAELAETVRERCERGGVEFRFGRRVEEIEPAAVRLDDGERIDADLVCIAVGIEPAIELAANAGLAVADGVVVNEQLQTSHPDVFAAGDIAQFPDPYFDTRRRVEHYGNAEYSGLVAGENMTGETKAYDHLIYVWSDVFDIHLEQAGDPTRATRFVRRDPAPAEEAGEGGRSDPGGGTPPPSFMLIGVSDGADDAEGAPRARVVAYMAVNRPDGELAPLQILMKKGMNVAGKEDTLADGSVPLMQLLKG